MRRLARSAKRRPLLGIGIIGLLLVAGAAFLGRDVIRIALMDEDPVDLTLPLAAPLEPAPGEVVYRIVAEESEATVTVDEVLAGNENEVELTSKGLAGDLAVADADASTARIGEVILDVHQLRSDNDLRDKVISHEYLESHDHREVRLHDAEVVDVEQADGSTKATFAIEGSLDVKEATRPVRFEASASLDGDTLTATATTTITMSEFGLGPISKVGLVSTGDDVEVTLRIVARDGRAFTPPPGLAEPAEVSAAGTGGPSYRAEVEPILEQNCASCHVTGQVGAQMLALDDAGDAAEVADGLAVVTGSRYMPPWPPSEVGIPLHDPRGLTQDEIDTLAEWAAARAPLDVAASTPLDPPEEPEVAVPRADVTLEMAEPYVGDGSKEDEYRCFVLDPGFTGPTTVTGYQFTPGSVEVVHHVLVYAAPASARDAVAALDAGDPGPGYGCGGGMGASTGGGRLVGGWVPGQRPRDFGDGVGFPFQAGDQLVAQIHYHYEGVLRPDRSRMALEVAPDPAAVTPLQVHQLVGPVELPCPATATGPLCDRGAAMADVRERFGTGAFLADVLHRVCGTTPEGLAAGSDGWTATTSCTFPMRRDATIVDVLGHMHEIGSKYRMTLNKGRPDEKVLLDIPVWNFAWQLNYQPVEPVVVRPGDSITVDCSWDRSLRYDPEPRYIVFAEGTEDEMCFSTIAVLPGNRP